MANCQEGDGDVPLAVTEFQQWFNSNGSEGGQTLLFLVEHAVLRDGCVRMDMAFSTGETFVLICPDGYPHTPRPLFQIRLESGGLKEWATRLNLFASDNCGRVKLGGFLSRAIELKRSDEIEKSAKEELMEAVADQVDEEGQAMDWEGDDTDSEPEDNISDEFAFTTDWEIKMDLRKKVWLKKEQEMRARFKAETDRDKADSANEKTSQPPPTCHGHLTDDYSGDDELLSEVKHSARAAKSVEKNSTAKLKEGQQIFTHSSAAFQILSTELIGLIKNGKDDGFTVDTIEENVYSWSVRIKAFPRQSNLSTELRNLEKKFGYDYIQLQLDFIPDFPFYPPLLRIVRPRFKGSIMQSLANIDLLKITYWNPTKTVHDVLKQIKDILLKHAVIDLKSNRNDISRHPDGAYHPVENHLIKLALATEVRPKANSTIIDVENLEKAPRVNRTSANEESKTAKECRGLVTYGFDKKEEASGKGWAKGTGYGTSRSFSISTYWTPEDYIRAQREKDRQINAILRDLNRSLDEKQMSIDMDSLYEIIEGSALIPFFEAELGCTNFMDMERHAKKYELIFDLLYTIGHHQKLLPLLCPLKDQRTSVMALLKQLAQMADLYLRKITAHASSSSATSVEASLKSTEKSVLPPTGKNRAKKAKVDKRGQCEAKSGSGALQHSEDCEKTLLLRIISLFNSLDETMTERNMKYSMSTTETDNETGEDHLESVYIRRLRPHLLDTGTAVLTNKGTAWRHHFADKANEERGQAAVRAVAREMLPLASSLPLALASSVFVRYDENRMHMHEALITGPENTPYANGCFLFHICFPADYPHSPPMVNLQTTGGRTVRFNPNLYNCGKVCLSLLGTWSGERGESWNSATSTLLQVLISIQSLIFIEDPYFNEPGYESQRGTSDGTKRSEGYNKNIRLNCAKWAILEQLKNPPPPFSHVIREHFRIKRDAVNKQMVEWLKLDKGLKDTVKHIKAELDKL